MAGFGIAVGTAHACTTTVIDLLADRVPGPLRVLCGAAPDYVLLDGTLAACDRGGDGRADYSAALPGRAHDLTAVRTHRIIRVCERRRIPVLGDRAQLGAGAWVTRPIRPSPGRDLSPARRTVSRAPSTARAPVGRGVARLKSWRSSAKPGAARIECRWLVTCRPGLAGPRGVIMSVQRGPWMVSTRRLSRLNRTPVLLRSPGPALTRMRWSGEAQLCRLGHGPTRHRCGCARRCARCRGFRRQGRGRRRRVTEAVPRPSR